MSSANKPDIGTVVQFVPGRNDRGGGYTIWLAFVQRANVSGGVMSLALTVLPGNGTLQEHPGVLHVKDWHARAASDPTWDSDAAPRFAWLGEGIEA